MRDVSALAGQRVGRGSESAGHDSPLLGGERTRASRRRGCRPTPLQRTTTGDVAAPGELIAAGTPCLRSEFVCRCAASCARSAADSMQSVPVACFAPLARLHNRTRAHTEREGHRERQRETERERERRVIALALLRVTPKPLSRQHPHKQSLPAPQCGPCLLTPPR